MADRREIVSVYAAGLAQGIALVTFPAASAVFRDPQTYALSSTEYGALFLPQALMSIAAAFAGANLHQRFGGKRTYLVGLTTNILAMLLLVLSRAFTGTHSLAFAILLAATTCLGLGFGLTVPLLNNFAAAFFPKKIDNAVLAMNALLGLGTALAPIFVALFLGLGIWWGLPCLTAGFLAVLLFESVFYLETNVTPKQTATRTAWPARFWFFSAFVFLYGICETVNGTWATPLLSKQFQASPALASIGLTIFWSAVTGGRIFFAAIARFVSSRWVCRLLPLILGASFLGLALTPSDHTTVGLLALALAGLGCSALLPLGISFAQQEIASASVAGNLIGFYEVGYGLAAFGVGPLQDSAGLDLRLIFGWSAFLALLLGGLSFAVTHPKS